MKILRASPADRGTAIELLQEYFAAIGVVLTDQPSDVDTFLADRNSGLWIAYAGDTPAGCVVLRPLQNVPDAGECKRLYVKPTFRGNGIAGALMDTLEVYARELGLTSVYLDSKDDLRDAIRLYERRGYQHCARYNDNPQATVFLRKAL